MTLLGGSDKAGHRKPGTACARRIVTESNTRGSPGHIGILRESRIENREDDPTVITFHGILGSPYTPVLPRARSPDVGARALGFASLI